MRKKIAKIFNGVLFHFEKHQTQKDASGEKRSVVILSAKYTIIMSIGFLAVVINFFRQC